MADKQALKDYRVTQPMQGTGYQNFQIPPGYKWVALVNNTDNIVRLNQERTSRPEIEDAILDVAPFNQRTFLVENGGQEYTLWWQDGGGLDFKKVELIFSESNLNMNGALTNEFEGIFTIGSDGVGLAKQAQFPSTLGPNGGLKTEVVNVPDVHVTNTLTVGTHAVTVSGSAAITDALNGVGGTGITIPTGGTGKIGWLSGIFQQTKASADSVGTKLDGVSALGAGGSGIIGWLSRLVENTFTLISKFPAALGSSGGMKTESLSDGVMGTGMTPPAGGSGIIGYLSGIFNVVTALLSVARPSVYTTRSGTIAVANTSQLVENSGTRSFFFIQNISSEDLWFKFNGAASINSAGSIKLIPGASFTFDKNTPSSAIHIVGQTVGQAFTIVIG